MPRMPEQPPTPYYAKWLPRTRRALSASGRLSELAEILSSEDQQSADAWSTRLRRILDGHEYAHPAIVFRIDRFLARPVSPPPTPSPELPLFRSP